MIIMKKAIALGLFVISVLFGMASVVLGTIIDVSIFVFIGMFVIGLGTVNLVEKILFSETSSPVRLVVSSPRKITKKKAKPSKKRRNR